MRVVDADTPHNFKDRGFLTFDTITLVPLQSKMIDLSMLNKQEVLFDIVSKVGNFFTDVIFQVAYINEYHQQCRKTVGAMLQSMGTKDGLQWLYKETEKIG